jgi:hypothetical protein
VPYGEQWCHVPVNTPLRTIWGVLMGIRNSTRWTTPVFCCKGSRYHLCNHISNGP